MVFKNQLKRDKDGCYETSLLWKQEQKHRPGNNKAGSIARLNNLIKKLQKDEKLFNKHDEIIQDQIKEGIVEIALQEAKGYEFYLPHRPVIRVNAESTKVPIVYDGSAKASNSTISLMIVWKEDHHCKIKYGTFFSEIDSTLLRYLLISKVRFYKFEYVKATEIAYGSIGF